MNEQGPRRIWLCADDYGIAPGVNAAIRDLVARGRLNATSVMVVAPSFSRAEADALAVLNAAEPRVAIGLHLTLTGPLKPLTAGYAPLADGAFLPLATTLRLAMQQRLDMAALTARIPRAVRSLRRRVRPPAGFRRRPSARASVSAGAPGGARDGGWIAPQAWVRQCGSSCRCTGA